MIFVTGLLAAATVTVRTDLYSHRHTTAAPRPGATNSDAYPPDPARVERAKVSGPPPSVPPADRVTGRLTLSSFATLGRHLPRGVLDLVKKRTWLLNAPISLGDHASLSIRGPGRVELGPGAFIEAAAGGAVRLHGVTIAAVDRQGTMLRAPDPAAGFLDAIDGGILVLDHDRTVRLGHLGVEAYGVSMREPGPGSAVERCTLLQSYIGVYLSHAAGVRIVGNRVLESVVYGIDPHTDSTGILIQSNVVRGSGVHGIILAVGVSNSQVVSNIVEDSGDHGIVLYERADHNVVRGNRISGGFDGIVVTDSSFDVVSLNTMSAIHRFGIRVSGASQGSSFVSNQVIDSLLGAYLYGGATGNSLLDNRLSGTLGDLRIRNDAPRNSVFPTPTPSEAAS